MKHAVRSFSIGLLTSAVIFLIIFSFVEDSVKTVEEIDINEMIEHIENEGYAVLDQQEYISYSVQKKQEVENVEVEESDSDENDSKDKGNESEEKTNDESNKETEEETNEEDEIEEEEEAEEEPENNVIHYTLTISTGMASSDISALLAEENIIENASDFNGYLDEHEYSLRVQIGSFEVSSDMSFYEIAERIAR